MAEMGKAMMGTGEGEGDERAVKAAEAAISNPLLEDTSMMGAKGVLINITGGYDMTLFEVDAAANRIRSEVDEDANIIFGSSVDEDMNGRIRVSVVATGIDAVVETPVAEKPKLVAMGGGQGSVNAVSNSMIPQGMQGGQPRGVPGAPVAPRPAMPQAAASLAGPVRVGPMAGQPRRPAGMAPAAPQPAAPAQPAGFAENQGAYAYEAPSPEDMPASIGTPAAEAPVRAAPQPAARPASAPPPVSAPSGGGFNLFRKATGLMRRNLGTEAEAPAAPQAPRAAAPQQQPAARPAAPQPAPEDMNGLDIPTFLRRQSN